jgi:hypothetical protein
LNSPKRSKEWYEEKSSDKESVDELICQQMTRSKTAEGLDRVEGNFLAVFPTDALTVTQHIPFCPAFASVPRVQAFIIDETDAKIHVFSPKTFGVRIDIKRTNIATDRLHFAIVAEG